MPGEGQSRANRWLLRAVAIAVASVVIVPATIVLVFAIQARVRLPELRPWHRLTLASEFRAGRPDTPKTFADYLRLEERLFAELRTRVMDDPAVADGYAIGRYNPKSIPARLALDTPFNRSYELVPDTVRGAVLLVHGLSDSPYAMRAIAELLRDQGFYVLVLRLPGHGTIPSGLLRVRWQDWYAAVELAAKHAAQRAGPDHPFYAGGFSTGAALTTLYCLRALDDVSLPRPSRLFLVSPAIGISKAAVLTKILASLSFIPYFEKSNWIDLLPEYDPYKYNSFPVNAARQIHALTGELRSSIETHESAGRLTGMPRVLAFQSLVDATITAHEIIGGLLLRLPTPGNELVVFDVNRSEALKDLIEPTRVEEFEHLRAAPAFPFRLTLITNIAPDSQEVAAFTREAGTRDVTETDLPLRWPQGVLSLGHVALPFRVDDPVYGLTPSGEGRPAHPLGALTVRGEAGTLVVPLGDLARLRSNPFFSVLKDRIVAVVEADRVRDACLWHDPSGAR
jgi:alpha-beta hydrolase superfamily lysophospholipase